MKPVISKEVCPCCDKEVEMTIEADEDYEWENGQPLLFRRCPLCENVSVDPKRNPDNMGVRSKHEKEA